MATENWGPQKKKKKKKGKANNLINLALLLFITNNRLWI